MANLVLAHENKRLEHLDAKTAGKTHWKTVKVLAFDDFIEVYG